MERARRDGAHDVVVADRVARVVRGAGGVPRHHQGAVVDRRYAEPIGAVPVTLTRDGRQDPLFMSNYVDVFIRDALILFPNDKDLRRSVQQIVRKDFASSAYPITDRLFLVTPDGTTLAELLEALRIDEHTLASALDPDEVSRIELEDGETRIIWKRPNNVSFRSLQLFEVSSIGLFIKGDRLTLVQAEEAPPFAETGPGSYGADDIWTSRRVGGEWSAPENLGPNINSAVSEHTSILTSDGRSLYITTTRAEGFGGEDNYVTTRSADGTWSKLVNLGPLINGSGDDRCPAWTPDLKIFLFDSVRAGGFGGLDLWWVYFQDVTLPSH